VQEGIAKVFRNRSGAIIAGVLAGVIAIILLVIYLNSYRSSVSSGSQAEPVLVATKLISKGTSGTLIAQNNLYATTSVHKDQLKLNAIVDPATLNDRVAVADIFPGQQLTQDDFTTESPDSIPYVLTGAQRAIAVNVDATHGLIGQVAAGNSVDIYVGTGDLVTLLMPDVYVLVAPGAGAPAAVLRINTRDAAKFAFAADHTTMWFVLRPQVGASRTPPTTATLTSLLAGTKR
jgi:Flp pilus assembly protein CpaB